ncbi:MAG TPA: DUF2569 domain-containing protein [Candidatus Paenibacillus intestinavium]|nr:DUF2569 domain-containing protein [Candidatus Paenibacillus intestinavium]
MEPNRQENNINYSALGLAGLGGWLILVQIGLYITIISLLVQLVQYSLPSLDPGVWLQLTSKDSEIFHPLWSTIIIFEVVWNVSLLIFCCFSLINLYLKKSIFPKLMIILYGSSLLVGIVDAALLAQIPLVQELEDGSTITDIIRSAITCAIWIPYFIKSQRVANTFVK